MNHVVLWWKRDGLEGSIFFLLFVCVCDSVHYLPCSPRLSGLDDSTSTLTLNIMHDVLSTSKHLHSIMFGSSTYLSTKLFCFKCDFFRNAVSSQILESHALHPVIQGLVWLHLKKKNTYIIKVYDELAQSWIRSNINLHFCTFFISDRTFWTVVVWETTEVLLNAVMISTFSFHLIKVILVILTDVWVVTACINIMKMKTQLLTFSICHIIILYLIAHLKTVIGIQSSCNVFDKWCLKR